MPKVIVNFRLEEERKKELDDFLEKKEIKLTNFFKEAIRFFMDNPHMLSQGKVELPSDVITKSDFQAFEDRMLTKMERQVAVIKEMRQLIADQILNGETAQRITSYKKVLLDCPHVQDLDTYKKVEDYLTTELPEQTQDIRENKAYNEALFELMQEGTLRYDVRLKRLIWMVK